MSKQRLLFVVLCEHDIFQALARVVAAHIGSGCNMIELYNEAVKWMPPLTQRFLVIIIWWNAASRAVALQARTHRPTAFPAPHMLGCVLAPGPTPGPLPDEPLTSQ